MKKTLLILSLFALPVLVNGQFALQQSNIQTMGNSINYHVADSNTVMMESTTGTGITWDYSGITGYNGMMKNGSVGDPDTTAFSTEFSTSTDYYLLEEFTGMYYTLSAGQMDIQGYVFEDVEVPLAGPTDVALVLSNDDIQALTFPHDVNTPLISDPYSGTVEGNGIPSSPASGNSYTEIDGEGTLMLPGQNFNDVVRVKTIDTANTAITIFTSTLNVEIRREQYEYRHSSSVFPLFSITAIEIVDTDNGDVLADFRLALSSVAPSSGIEEEKLTSSISLYPNPAKDWINLNIKMDQAGTGHYDVINSLGQSVISSPLDLSKGTNQQKIDINELPYGMYFVKVEVNGQVATKKISKR